MQMQIRIIIIDINFFFEPRSPEIFSVPPCWFWLNNYERPFDCNTGSIILDSSTANRLRKSVAHIHVMWVEQCETDLERVYF